ncbi:MAG: hypothetical protein ACLQD9_08310 [Thermoplasmata archaeon]
MNENDLALGRRSRGRLAGAFPWPFVGTAVILSVLIVLTPVLFSNGPPAPGSLEAQAVLVVDRVSGPGTTHFYVRAVGSTVRYDSISIGLATGFAWNGGNPAWPTNWTWTNETQVLELGASSTQNPVAIDVTAVYAVSGAVADYAGILAFYVSGSGSGETLSIAVSSNTPGVSAPSSVPDSQLPEPLSLQDFGSGSPP